MRKFEIVGRIYDIRTLGKRLSFATLRTATGDYQCVFNGKPDIPAESIVRVSGDSRPSEKSSRFDQEISVEEYEIVSANQGMTTSQFRNRPYSKAVLPHQHVYMRQPHVHERMMMKWSAIKLIRDEMTESGFIEVQSPRIVGEMTDGPTMVFPVDFFGAKAYLSLSNLLYHTAFVSADFPAVFEVSPLFRADLNHSSQHLSEFLILEVTAAYKNRKDLMAIAENVVSSVCERTSAKLDSNELDDIPVLTYEELAAITEKADGPAMAHGEQIKRYHAKAVAKHLNRTLFWVIDMPAKHKAFFSSTRFDESARAHVANDFRLFWNEIDIVDGGERVNCPARLRERIVEQGLDAEHFGYYLEVVSGGLPPLTGFGLGIERLLAKALDITNIREIVPFPRFVGHLEP